MKTNKTNNSTQKINWGRIGTHALCTAAELLIITIFGVIRYRIDIKFDKKDRDAKEKERLEKEEEYGY